MANGPIIAVLQAMVAPDYQGRVFTLMGSISAGITPLGLVLAGPIAALIGVRMWYVIGGSVCLAMGLLAFFVRAIVNIESTSGQGTAANEPGRERATRQPSPARRCPD